MTLTQPPTIDPVGFSCRVEQDAVSHGHCRGKHPTPNRGQRTEVSKSGAPVFYWDLARARQEGEEALEGHGIALTPLRGVVEATAMLHAADSGVVLVAFPAQVTDKQLERLEQTLVHHPRFAWIALVAGQWQRQERLCALITRAFYDFHHLPPQGGRLRTLATPCNA